MSRKKALIGGLGVLAVLLVVVIGCGSLAAYVTHIVWLVSAAELTGSAIALLIVGIFIAPVGVIHGVALWLGYTWINVPEKVAMLVQWLA